jgi:DNA helicase-2/ATP-dependent DNA helicase PcrA
MYNNFDLNDAQLKAVQDTEGAVLVIAGAGSGKTRVLTARICHLVEKGVNPYNILAITFTNKAAGEMKNRIESSLGMYSSIWVSTFHAMCARILRYDCDRLGYDSNFTIYTDLESERVVKRLCPNIPGADVKKKGDYLWHISNAKTLAMSPEEYY